MISSSVNGLPTRWAAARPKQKSSKHSAAADHGSPPSPGPSSRLMAGSRIPKRLPRRRHRRRRGVRRAAPALIRRRPHLEHQLSAVGDVRMAEPGLVQRLAVQRGRLKTGVRRDVGTLPGLPLPVSAPGTAVLPAALAMKPGTQSATDSISTGGERPVWPGFPKFALNSLDPARPVLG